MPRARAGISERDLVRASVCKVLSIILMSVGTKIFLIIGSVLVSLNVTGWDFGNESLDEASARSA